MLTSLKSSSKLHDRVGRQNQVSLVLVRHATHCIIHLDFFITQTALFPIASPDCGQALFVQCESVSDSVNLALEYKCETQHESSVVIYER